MRKALISSLLAATCLTGTAYAAPAEAVPVEATAYTRAERNAELRDAEASFYALKKQLGARDRETLSAMRRLTAACMAAEKYSDALQLNEKLLSLTESLYGKAARESCAVLNDRAGILLQLGRREEAFSILLDIHQEIVSEDDEENLRFVQNCALYYRDISLPNMAGVNDRMAQSLQQFIFGEETEKQITTLLNLADDYRSLTRNEDALEFAQQGLIMAERFHGSRHPVTARAW